MKLSVVVAIDSKGTSAAKWCVLRCCVLRCYVLRWCVLRCCVLKCYVLRWCVLRCCDWFDRCGVYCVQTRWLERCLMVSERHTSMQSHYSLLPSAYSDFRGVLCQSAVCRDLRRSEYLSYQKCLEKVPFQFKICAQKDSPIYCHGSGWVDGSTVMWKMHT